MASTGTREQNTEPGVGIRQGRNMDKGKSLRDQDQDKTGQRQGQRKRALRSGWRLDRAVTVARDQNPELGIVIRQGRYRDKGK